MTVSCCKQWSDIKSGGCQALFVVPGASAGPMQDMLYRRHTCLQMKADTNDRLHSSVTCVMAHGGMANAHALSDSGSSQG